MNGADNGSSSSVEWLPSSDYKDEFERVQELGRGKFGIVYEVKRKENGEERFAAKHIK
jgi:hypothetical protein